MIYTPIKSIIKSALFFLFHILTRLIKISSAVGSSFFFPLSTAFWPLLGINAGLSELLITFSVTYFLHFFMGSCSLLWTLHLPTFAGAFYWMIITHPTISRFTKISLVTSLSLFSAFLFIIHPIGYYAAPYALFWIIPIITTIWAKNSQFLHALGSTFICHAIGSILWLYTKPHLTASYWLALIPAVCVERLFIALLMASCYYLVLLSYRYFSLLALSSIPTVKE